MLLLLMVVDMFEVELFMVRSVNVFGCVGVRLIGSLTSTRYVGLVRPLLLCSNRGDRREIVCMFYTASFCTRRRGFLFDFCCL